MLTKPHVNLIVGSAAVGILCVALFAFFCARLLNVALGPSVNTINMCKEVEREGYLADECFDEYGTKDRHCKRTPARTEGEGE